MKLRQDTSMQWVVKGLASDDQAASSLRQVSTSRKGAVPVLIAKKGGNTEQYLTNVLHVDADGIYDERNITGDGIQRAADIIKNQGEKFSILYMLKALNLHKL